MMKKGFVIATLAAAVFSLFLSFVPTTSFAVDCASVEGLRILSNRDEHRIGCSVTYGDGQECTLGDMDNGSFYYSRCANSEGNKTIVFPLDSGPPKMATIDTPITINLQGKNVTLIGATVGHGTVETDCYIDGGGGCPVDYYTISDPPGVSKAMIGVDGNLSNNPITVIGPGILILRNINFRVDCDPVSGCKSTIKLTNGAKLIIEQSNVSLDVGIVSFVEVDGWVFGEDGAITGRGNAGTFSEHISFSEVTDDSDVGDTTIDAGSLYIFSFKHFNDAPSVTLSDFQKVIFDFSGNLTDVFAKASFWEGGSRRIINVNGQPAIRCEMQAEGRLCNVDNSRGTLKFTSHTSDSTENEVMFIEKGTGKIVNGGNFTQEGTTYHLSLPATFDPKTTAGMTNLGQKLIFGTRDMRCPNGRPPTLRDGEIYCTPPPGAAYHSDDNSFICDYHRARYDRTSNSCVCTDFDVNSNYQYKKIYGVWVWMCWPKSGWEWERGDFETGTIRKECQGAAVPINDSEIDAERCVCTDPDDILTWERGRSRCKSPSSDPPPDDDPTHTQTNVQTNSGGQVEYTPQGNTVTADEQRCLDTGCNWRPLDPDEKCQCSSTEDNTGKGDSNNKVANSAGGCSLIPDREITKSLIWAIFVAIPLIVMSRRRAGR